MRFHLITFLFALAFVSSAHATVKTFSSLSTAVVQPLSLRYKTDLTFTHNALALPAPQPLQQKSDSLDKVLRFASPRMVSLNTANAGEWRIVGDQAIWQLRINAADTYSLNIAMRNISLPASADLFVYSADHSQLVHYTAQDIHSHGELWTPIFDTSSLLLELNLPLADKLAAQLSINQINQGVVSIYDAYKSGACNVDVACSLGNSWQNEISSVVLLSISGSGLCTGTLVNNTAQDGAPYILTADHCGITSAAANSLVFYWDYQSTLCGGVPDGALNSFNNGSVVVAANGTSDFTLLKMYDLPPMGKYYAGWDYSTAAPLSVVGIHHPKGAEKSISLDNDASKITDYGSNISDASGHFLYIAAWDQGTTEQGSSGSAIWNSNKHIVGTLTGGLAGCIGNSSIDNGLPDWYGRMASHWQHGSTASTRLSNWLDPNTISTGTLNSTQISCSPPSANFSISGSTHIDEDVQFSATASGGDTATYAYAWDFNGDNIIDSTASNPSYQYNTTYAGAVHLKVTDNNCSQFVTKKISISTPNSSNETNSGGGFIDLRLLLFIGLLCIIRLAVGSARTHD